MGINNALAIENYNALQGLLQQRIKEYQEAENAYAARPSNATAHSLRINTLDRLVKVAQASGGVGIRIHYDA